MGEEVYIVFTVFSSIVLVFVLWFYFRYKAREEMQKTFRLALEKGTELSPDFIKQLGEPEQSKEKDLRRGLIWLAIGVAFAILGVAVDEADAIGPMLGVSAFPGLVGVAFLIMWRFGSKKD